MRSSTARAGTPLAEWHTMTYLVLTCRKTPIDVIVNQHEIHLVMFSYIPLPINDFLCAIFTLILIVYVMSDVVRVYVF